MTPENVVAVDSSLIGQFLDDRYRLEEVISIGGLGSVYRATHLKLQRSVAVKLLHEDIGASELQRGRFAREATALAALEHPNIVSVRDYGVAGERPYLVMELLEGETLSRRLQRTRMRTESALWVTRQLLAALAFMHRSGLVHRDLKPSNVFLQRLKSGFERVKLLDFGLAKYTAPALAGVEATLTRDGAIVGTPAYMSPEQASGEVVDARGDVYAVGVILYRMLSGRLPFEGDATDQLRGHLVGPIPPLELLDSATDPALEALIQRSMAKGRAERFEDAADMLRGLLALAPRYQFDTVPVRGGSDPVSEEVATTDWLMHLEDSNEIPTLPRPARPEGFRERVTRRVRRAVRFGVRVISTTSVLMVGAALALLAYLLQDDADRAELAAFHRRVSARVVERAVLDAAGARTDLRAARAPVPEAPTEKAESSSAVATEVRETAAEPTSGADESFRVPELPEGPEPGLGAQLEQMVASEELPYAAEYTSGLGPRRPSDEVDSALGSHAPMLAANSDERREPPGGALAERTPRDGLARAEPASTRALAAASVPRATPPVPRPAAALVAAPSPQAAPRDRVLDAAPARSSLPAPLAPAVRVAPKSSVVALGAKLDAPVEAAPSATSDPWAAALPPQLRAARRAVLNASRGNEPMVLALRAYNREHAADPRGHLLLAELYMNRLWRGDALSQYTFALADQASARNAPEVLPGLIKLVIHGEFTRPAERLIARTYGAAAIPSLDRALERLAPDDRAGARLRALRARLTTTNL